jgi:uracil-DNA glycosylase
LVTGLRGPGTPNVVTPDARFPFGAQLRSLVQEDRAPKRGFVLGVYASAVHARWIGPDGRVLVRALAVASEPTIFWTGAGADAIVAGLDIPRAAGRLEPAEPALNGPSGRSLDDDYLGPLGVSRTDAWLCDLVPHACVNPSQQAAIEREYEPRRAALGLPLVSVPPVPSRLADDARRREILEEIEAARPEVLVLLGDQPIRYFLAHYDRRGGSLSDFGVGNDYGRLHEGDLAGRKLQVLPLAHPRQVGGLGAHSDKWREMHAAWRGGVAPGLLAMPAMSNPPDGAT